MAECKESSSDDSVVKAVAERLRFFYSDANVRSDYFMRQKLLKSEGGLIPIEILLKFNSIKCHTTDPAVVVEAAKTLSDRLVLSDDEKAVGRVVPFAMSQMDDNIPLSLYVSNVPVTKTETEGDKPTRPKYAISVTELRRLFEPYGSVTLVKLRFKQAESDGGDASRSPNKRRQRNYPAGAAFVEYETEAELKAAAAELCTTKDGEPIKPTKPLQVGGNVLEVSTLENWIAVKKKLEAAQKEETEETPEKEKDEEGKEEGKEEEKPEESKKRDHEQVDEEVHEEFTIDWKPRCVVSIKGLPEACDREALRAMVAQHLGVSDEDVKDKGIYVDYSRGQTHGAVRFSEPSDDVEKIAAKLNSGDVLVGGEKVASASVLDGEEETKYWQNFIDFKRKQMKQRREERISNKKRFRSGYRGRRN